MHFRCLPCDYIVLSKSKLGASTATPVFTTAASERFVNSLIQSFSTMLAGLAITFLQFPGVLFTEPTTSVFAGVLADFGVVAVETGFGFLVLSSLNLTYSHTSQRNISP